MKDTRGQLGLLTMLIALSPSVHATAQAGKEPDERRASLGVLVYPDRSDIERDFAKVGARRPPQGVVIGEAIEGTSADREGLKCLDVIYAIDDCRVTDYASYVQCSRDIEPGTLVTLKIKRPIEGQGGIRWGSRRVRIETVARDVADRRLEELRKKEEENKAARKAEADRRTTHGFRGVPWGASQSTARKRESGEPTLSEADLLVYDGTIAGFSADVGYSFVDDQLVAAVYVFKTTHSNATLFLPDYATVRQRIVEKYGAPSKDDTLWLNELFRNDPSHWGTAIEAGHLALEATWELIDTVIVLHLSGDNFKTVFVVKYSSREHREMAEKARSKKGRDDF